jgi:hypothetical protein
MFIEFRGCHDVLWSRVDDAAAVTFLCAIGGAVLGAPPMAWARAED